ncbi:hypothetical protein BS50DRAFT_138076 [Corynespora cassiicola Philippines]|uniref:Mid2 domain-containing protein n=1 Tax=Corynespora cassiicola Philippines TaxID=1448308 RepID=A0A2T2N9K5_CORCC|nr:hypothetical protein BS50DRAFT_138076 [Corynespora cassiicola Philippines]
MDFDFTLRVFKLLLIILSVSTVTEALCYTPNGALASDIPCKAGVNSTCCQNGYTCLEPNLCLSHQNVGLDGLSANDIYTRASCTDESWTSGECSQVCTKGAPNSFELVVHCGDGVYCCYEDAANCCKDDKAEKFDLGDPTPYRVIGQSGPVNTLLSKTSSTATANTTTSTPPPSASSTASRAENPSVSPNTISGNQIDKTVAVGLGVGIPLGVILISMMVGMIWWTRRMKRQFQVRQAATGQEKAQSITKVAEMYCPPSVSEMSSQRDKAEMP